jgi:eukaryotic-like serine/threonine-protein kinase
MMLFAGLVFPCFSADWPMFRGNRQHTGYCADVVGFPGSFPLWVDSLKTAIVSSPSVVDNMLFIGSRDSGVYAIETQTGKISWKRKTGGWVDASPLVQDGKVVVGSRDGFLYLMDMLSGAVLHTIRSGLQLSSVITTSGGDIISASGPPYNTLSIYNSPFLTSATMTPVFTSQLPQLTYSSPAIFGTVTAIGSNNGAVLGINTATGKTLWSYQTAGGIYLSSPAISDSTLYIAPGDADRSVYAIDLNTGSLYWKKASGASQALSKKSSANTIRPEDFVKLLRLSPADRDITINRLKSSGIAVPDVFSTGQSAFGRGLQKRAASPVKSFYSYGEIRTSSVAVGEKNVYVVQKELGYPGQKFSIIAFDKYFGDELWSFSDTLPGNHFSYCSSPVVTSSAVFFGWAEGRIYGLDKSKGTVLWRDTLEGDIISSPAIANGNLYVATTSGYLYAYSLNAAADGTDFQTGTYCYPNPARGNASHILLYVAKAAVADLTLYNASEMPVFRLSRHLSANEKFTYDWNLTSVVNGVYFAFIKVKYGDGTSDKKLIKVAVLR